MGEYTKRTCYCCGKRDIQPNMTQISIDYRSGSSNAGVTFGTFVGAAFDDKKSKRQVNNWFWGNSKRQYRRTRKVWVCPDCAKSTKSKVEWSLGDIVKVFFWGLIVLWVLAVLFA